MFDWFVNIPVVASFYKNFFKKPTTIKTVASSSSYEQASQALRSDIDNIAKKESETIVDPRTNEEVSILNLAYAIFNKTHPSFREVNRFVQGVKSNDARMTEIKNFASHWFDKDDDPTVALKIVPIVEYLYKNKDKLGYATDKNKASIYKTFQSIDFDQLKSELSKPANKKKKDLSKLDNTTLYKKYQVSKRKREETILTELIDSQRINFDKFFAELPKAMQELDMMSFRNIDHHLDNMVNSITFVSTDDTDEDGNKKYDLPSSERPTESSIYDEKQEKIIKSILNNINTFVPDYKLRKILKLWVKDIVGNALNSDKDIKEATDAYDYIKQKTGMSTRELSKFLILPEEGINKQELELTTGSTEDPSEFVSDLYDNYVKQVPATIPHFGKHGTFTIGQVSKFIESLNGLLKVLPQFSKTTNSMYDTDYTTLVDYLERVEDAHKKLEDSGADNATIILFETKYHYNTLNDLYNSIKDKNEVSTKDLSTKADAIAKDLRSIRNALIKNINNATDSAYKHIDVVLNDKQQRLEKQIEENGSVSDADKKNMRSMLGSVYRSLRRDLVKRHSNKSKQLTHSDMMYATQETLKNLYVDKLRDDALKFDNEVKHNEILRNQLEKNGQLKYIDNINILDDITEGGVIGYFNKLMTPGSELGNSPLQQYNTYVKDNPEKRIYWGGGDASFPQEAYDRFVEGDGFLTIEHGYEAKNLRQFNDIDEPMTFADFTSNDVPQDTKYTGSSSKKFNTLAKILDSYRKYLLNLSEHKDELTKKEYDNILLIQEDIKNIQDDYNIKKVEESRDTLKNTIQKYIEEIKKAVPAFGDIKEEDYTSILKNKDIQTNLEEYFTKQVKDDREFSNDSESVDRRGYAIPEQKIKTEIKERLHRFNTNLRDLAKSTKTYKDLSELKDKGELILEDAKYLLEKSEELTKLFEDKKKDNTEQTTSVGDKKQEDTQKPIIYDKDPLVKLPPGQPPVDPTTSDEENTHKTGFTYYGIHTIASLFKLAEDKYTIGFNPEQETKEQKLLENPGTEFDFTPTQDSKAADTEKSKEFSMEKLGKVLNSIKTESPDKYAEIQKIIKQSSAKSGEDLLKYLVLWEKNNWNGSAALRAYNNESVEHRDNSYFWSMFERNVWPAIKEHPSVVNAVNKLKSNKPVNAEDVNTNKYKKSIACQI